MKFVNTILAFSAKQARWLLIVGLLAGIFIPQLAIFVRPYIGELIASLLFVAALRASGKTQFSRKAFALPVATMISLQLVLPVLAIIVVWMTGWTGVFASAFILMLAASPISGSPNLTLMVGGEAQPALVMLLTGTAILPFTIVPVFLLADQFGSAAGVAVAAGKLLIIILVAAFAAFFAKKTIMKRQSSRTITILDGLGAILMAAVVIGLMDAVGPAIWNETALFVKVLAFAFALNFGAQFVGILLNWVFRYEGGAAALAIACGNRNMALFLTALPAAITDPLLLFIGCYQVPMYLTPLIMKPVLDRLNRISDRN